MGVLVRSAVCLAFAFLISLATQGAALAERRIALVIGNGKYENAGVLANPVNDASAIGALFKNAGFDLVDLRLNLGVVEFKRAVREFVDRAANADVAVVYYSGHGLEFGGVNYLIPVDAKLMSVLDVDDEAVSLDRILMAAGRAKKLSLIILDACRENPFHPAADHAGVTRGLSMGLAGVDQTGADTLIAFAAKAGSVSYDGDGLNSPFTTALLKYITRPGLDIRLALGKVRDDVLRATNYRQEPYVYGSLGGDNVALVPAVAAAPSATAAAPPPPAPDTEASDYRTAERTGSLDGWRSFLAVHPDGSHARLARAEIDKLLAGQKVEASRTAVTPLSPDELCRQDEERLVRLRANPTSDEAERFASELNCERLRPQLSRLMESLGFAIPPPRAASAPQGAAVGTAPDCASEQAELDRLRAQPSVDGAQAFWRRLQCERLRPQARLLMESLNLTPDNASAALPKANDVRAVVAPGDSPPTDPAACDREQEELNRLRANPNRRDAERFARGMTCQALKPQAARLLESLAD
jgi:Caspase domain